MPVNNAPAIEIRLTSRVMHVSWRFIALLPQSDAHRSWLRSNQKAFGSAISEAPKGFRAETWG
jgi:hypothetical protein